MATISVTIPEVTEYTVTPSRLSPTTFFVDRETRLSEEATRIPEQNAQAKALNDFATEANAVRDEVNGFTTAATNAKTAAEAAATTAQSTANALLWVSGQTYIEGESAISLTDHQTYRATTATSGTTDPSASGDWISLNTTINNTLTSTSTTEALSANMGKTLENTKAPKANPIFTGANYTAVANDFIYADTLTTGAFTVTLPSTPTTNDKIVIFNTDITNTLTVNGNGNSIILKDVTDTTLEINSVIKLEFIFDSTNWRVS